MADAAATIAPLRVPCPQDGRRGPALMACSHLRLDGGPEWRVVPWHDGLWGFACPTCSVVMAGVVSAADIDQDAAADLALRIMRPICQHCLAEARGSRWMAVQAAIADVLHNVQHCGLCGGPPDRVRSFRTDGGLMIVATCSGCEAGRQDGERVDVDADCARFVPDPD